MHSLPEDIHPNPAAQACRAARVLVLRFGLPPATAATVAALAGLGGAA
jgi:hypothetical protein